LNPQCGPKQTLITSRRFSPTICKSVAYIPDMSCDDSKRARHRQRQAAYEARLRDDIGLFSIPRGDTNPAIRLTRQARPAGAVPI
jgi:hypothetical protein